MGRCRRSHHRWVLNLPLPWAPLRRRTQDQHRHLVDVVAPNELHPATIRPDDVARLATEDDFVALVDHAGDAEEHLVDLRNAEVDASLLALHDDMRASRAHVLFALAAR
eukprot:14345336-Heterocapsa_arctica.AAC.1